MTDNDQQPTDETQAATSPEQLEAMKAGLADEYDLTDAQAKKLTGETYDELRESAEVIVSRRRKSASDDADDETTTAPTGRGEFLPADPENGIVAKTHRFR